MRQFLVVCLVLVAPCASRAAFRFTGWSDNHVTYETYRARFDWVAQQMNQILGGGPVPAFHISGGDCENGGHDITTNILTATCPSFKSWSYVPQSRHVVGERQLNGRRDNTRIILLISIAVAGQLILINDGRVCAYSYWLETQLDGSHPFVFVVGHEPVSTTGTPPQPELLSADRTPSGNCNERGVLATCAAMPLQPRLQLCPRTRSPGQRNSSLIQSSDLRPLRCHHGNYVGAPY
jgi:hypothetical protein